MIKENQLKKRSRKRNKEKFKILKLKNQLNNKIVTNSWFFKGKFGTLLLNKIEKFKQYGIKLKKYLNIVERRI